MPIRGTVVEVGSDYAIIQSDYGTSGTKYLLSGEHPYVLGEEGRIRAGYRDFEFESLREAEEEKKALERRQAERAEADRISRERWKAETLAHNDAIALPFEWAPVEFIRLAMLHERGTGSGRARNSVGHILALEDFQIGRFSRKKGEVLCGQSAKFDDDFSFHGENFVKKQRDSVRASCKGCMKKAEAIAGRKNDPSRAPAGKEKIKGRV